MTTWTAEQNDAITARNCNLLVAAGAGSGKTAVLVERIVRLIVEDGADIDRMLIVTFTNAAAGEMRERISSAVLAGLEKPGQNEQHLQKQLGLLSRASISTIHSFCAGVVRDNFHIVGVDPDFRVANDAEAALMKTEVVDELFEAEYEKGNELFHGLVEMFGGGRDDTALRELVLGCYEFAQSQPYPMRWLEQKVQAFAMGSVELEQSPWVKVLVEQFEIELAGAKELFTEAKNIAAKPGGPVEYIDALNTDLAVVDELSLSLKRGLSHLCEALRGVKYSRLRNASKASDEALVNAAKELRNEGKKLIGGMQSMLAKSPEEYVEELNALYPYMSYLFAMVAAFDRRYAAAKAEKGVLDFGDLEHYALEILSHREVAAEYRHKYDYIFVDEYQDSNRVQETILSFIKRDDNLFLVGDVKQSIYRFRLADPSLFLEKCDTFKNSADEPDRRIDLGVNFRSVKGIIDGVNFIFRHIMSKRFGEIDYDESAELRPGVETEAEDEPVLEVCIIEKNTGQVDPGEAGEGGKTDEAGETNETGEDGKTDEAGEETETLEDIEVEARVAAERIKSLVGSEIYDTKSRKMRAIDYADIVVLLRTVRNWGETFAEVFAASGIPTYADIDTGYFDALEVGVFMNLLAVIDNKKQDVPLLSVMRSPIGGFGIDDLIKIRAASPDGMLCEAVHEYAKNGEDAALRIKTAAFLEKLGRWQDESRFTRLDDFIWKLMTDTGYYYYYVGAMPGGELRQANLRVLVDRAAQFEAASIRGLSGFIKFVDKLKDSNSDLSIAKVLGENDNVVRIMSIHKSKGLEFPVVIIAGMGKKFNLRDSKAPVLFHKDLGLGPDFVDPALRICSDTIAKAAIKTKIRLESLSEEMRILYVAATRPKNKLIMIGSVRNLENTAKKKWSKPANPFNLAKGQSFLDWVCPVLIRHKDGEKLRELAGAAGDDIGLLEDASKWSIQIIDRTCLSGKHGGETESEQKLRERLQNFSDDSPSPAKAQVIARLNWNYPFAGAVKIPSKLSVTQLEKLHAKHLNRAGMDIPPLINRPKFAEGEKRFTAAERGSVIHFVMQHLDLRRVGSEKEILAQVAEMVEKELLKREEAASVDAAKILRFFESDLGRRVLRAPEVYREAPFNLVCRAHEVIEGLEYGGEQLLVQGVIDIYFREGEELVLIDYKTDRVSGRNSREVAGKYESQVRFYRAALEKILSRRVKESYIYLLDSGEAFAVHRNDPIP